ncbi:tektin-2-like isoform X2 [Myxocyprinus asiaticus]|uniref:tektin-2-like isoform X2 n=1 Tax=Myxocyprinus asiaticus TaxID=70543 RepID=UPI002222C9E1|nr:tektin-2-like isoform X2 [Myxocyprinus asiaticus]
MSCRKLFRFPQLESNGLQFVCFPKLLLFLLCALLFLWHQISTNMATLSMKPGLRYSVSDWTTNNKQISDTAEHRRKISHEIRQDGRALRNQTANKTNWDEYESSRRLSDRINDITRWKENLKACAQEVDVEMDALTLSKEETERALAATVLPLEVTAECLTLREGRRGMELVSDPVEAELKKEVEVTDGAQRILQQCIDQAFEHLCRLQEVRQQLTIDLQDKIEALDVDMSCLSLTIQSPEISLKPNPTRVPPGTTTPQQWEHFSRYNITRAKEEMQASMQLRENSSITRAQVQNELEAQRMAMEFALRKRTHHLEQAHQELQWQLKTTRDEIAELEKDIAGLENDIQAKMAPLKLVHTRLENRIKRPGMDLCRDEVQFGLVEEAKQLDATILTLKKKLAQAQHSLQSLKQHEAQMTEDLSRKQDALSLEQRSSQTRQRLTLVANTERLPSAVVPLTNSCGRHKLDLA